MCNRKRQDKKYNDIVVPEKTILKSEYTVIFNEKVYYAVVEGFVKEKKKTLLNYLKKDEKTNVMRTLEQKKIVYTAHTYPHEDGVAVDGVTVAGMLGVPAERVYKTLVTQGKSGAYFVFVVPVQKELDLKKAAKVAGEKSIEMVPVKELLSLTGYIRGGCSPVGMKKKYPTFIEESCILYDEIAVSAGERGHQMILDPQALMDLTGAQAADLIV